MELIHGRPETNDGRLPKEIRVYDLLDSLGISYERVDHEEAMTMEVCAAIDEALRCKETGEEKTILFGLTGTGYFDLNAYTAYKTGTMTNYIPTDEELARCAAELPQIAED